jgi:phosphatidylserine/phosphatidylglycerophosphate/cardiolipin synthase-like enzyme
LKRLALILGLCCAFGTAKVLHAAPLAAKGSVEVLFTPWDDAESAILRVLREARQTVHVQAYLLTSRSLAQGLREAQERGVKVSILADQEMERRGQNSQLPGLIADGVEVNFETRYAAAHNKIILIDAASAQPIVITGSYNFTWSAQARNAENMLILRGHPELARRYLDNWLRHQAEASAPN